MRVEYIGELYGKVGGKHIPLGIHSSEIDRKDDRIESLEDFVRSVVDWPKAYPETVFTEPTPEQVDAVCKTLGCRIDNIAAMILRGYTKQWARMASELLKEGK